MKNLYDSFPIPKPKHRHRQREPSAAEKRRILDELCDEQDNICYLCGESMTREFDEWFQAVIEHVQPGKMGGSKDWSRPNLRAAHWKCNSAKGSVRPAVVGVREVRMEEL